VSTSSQRENYSLPEQERLCREWCAEQGYTVTALFSDVDEGDDYYGRRGFSTMRQAMARREFDAIVFLEQDRLVARGGPKHMYALQTECEEYEVKLFCVLEPLHDAEDEDAGLVDYIEARHARSEKQKIAVRTQRGRSPH
jgi:DNA invertase Pin-like site-specific DNA recombinase